VKLQAVSGACDLSGSLASGTDPTSAPSRWWELTASSFMPRKAFNACRNWRYWLASILSFLIRHSSCYADRFLGSQTQKNTRTSAPHLDWQAIFRKITLWRFNFEKKASVTGAFAQRNPGSLGGKKLFQPLCPQF